MSTIYFISGHLDLTQEEFEKHYALRIIEIFNEHGNDAYFVVGDARGADTLAQTCLHQLYGRNSKNVTVYHMFEEPRNNAGFQVCGGFKSDKERDEAMTNASDEDIAWVRPGREKSGTAKNIKRRTR